MKYLRSNLPILIVSASRENNRNQGFTLVELMIALAVGGLVLTAVMTAFLSQHRSYLAQDDVVEMQQNGRVAMDMLTRDIRTAGFDPNNLGAGIITAQPNSLRFTREDDLPANGLETISYTLYDAFATPPSTNDGRVDDLGLRTWNALGGSAGRQVVAENISQLLFRYLDKDGEITGDLSKIRSIQVSMLVEASQPDPNFNDTVVYTTAYTSPTNATATLNWGPFNNNLRRRLLITTIKCRNQGL